RPGDEPRHSRDDRQVREGQAGGGGGGRALGRRHRDARVPIRRGRGRGHPPRGGALRRRGSDQPRLGAGDLDPRSRLPRGRGGRIPGPHRLGYLEAQRPAEAPARRLPREGALRLDGHHSLHGRAPPHRRLVSRARREDRLTAASSRPAGEALAGSSVTFVSLSYWPDQAAVPRLLTDLAEDCAAAGAVVTVLTSRTQYVQFSDAKLPRHEQHSGVEIRRLRATRIGRRTRLGRIVDYGSFLGAVLLRLLFGPWEGTVVCGSLPPMLSVAVAAAAAVRRR